MLFNLKTYGAQCSSDATFLRNTRLFFGTNDQLIELINKYLKQKKKVLILGNPRFRAYKSCYGVDHVISKESVSRALRMFWFGTSPYDVIINFTSSSESSSVFSLRESRTLSIKYEYVEKLLKLLPILELKVNRFLDMKNFYV